jgi:hypothetical protein
LRYGELRCSEEVLWCSENVLREDPQGGPGETGWGPPVGSGSAASHTLSYTTHFRDAQSNCKERLVSNDIVQVSRFCGLCCGMSCRLTMPPALDTYTAFACTRGIAPAGRRGIFLRGLSRRKALEKRLTVVLRSNVFCLAVISLTTSDHRWGYTLDKIDYHVGGAQLALRPTAPVQLQSFALRLPGSY